MDFVEVGSMIEIHSDYVWGVLDDLPKGKITLIKVQPMIFIGGGFLAPKHKNHDLGLLGVFGGGPALDLLNGGWVLFTIKECLKIMKEQAELLKTSVKNYHIKLNKKSK